jgi:hypothetical protein
MMRLTLVLGEKAAISKSLGGAGRMETLAMPIQRKSIVKATL